MVRRILRWFDLRPFGLSWSMGWRVGAAGVCLLSATDAFAVSCTTQAEMKGPERDAMVAAARAIASNVQSGNVSGVRAATIPSVASNFDRIASTISNLSPTLKGGALSVTSVYDLQAMDAPPGESQLRRRCRRRRRATCLPKTSAAIPSTTARRFPEPVAPYWWACP